MLPAQGSLAGRTHTASRGRDAGTRAPPARAGIRRAAGVVPQLPPRPGRPRLALARTGRGKPASALTASRPPHETPAQTDVGSNRVPLRLRRALALALSSRASIHVEL